MKSAKFGETPLDRSSLVAHVEAGGTFKFRTFWGHRPRPDGRLSDGCFSQFWACRFELKEQEYSSAEQWMMSCKARMFGDTEVLERILATEDPDEAKQLGRSVRGFDEDAWNRVVFDVVTIGNVAKFGQDNELRYYLLGTDDAVLIEASPVDQVWGIGLSCKGPEVRDPRLWRGMNRLGFALMRTREVLLSRVQAPQLPVLELGY